MNNAETRCFRILHIELKIMIKQVFRLHQGPILSINYKRDNSQTKKNIKKVKGLETQLHSF